jgi:hypothetical protein
MTKAAYYSWEYVLECAGDQDRVCFTSTKVAYRNENDNYDHCVSLETCSATPLELNDLATAPPRRAACESRECFTPGRHGPRTQGDVAEEDRRASER